MYLKGYLLTPAIMLLKFNDLHMKNGWISNVYIGFKLHFHQFHERFYSLMINAFDIVIFL